MGDEGRPIQENRLAAFARRLEINREYYTQQDSANKRLAVYAEAMLVMLADPKFRDHISDFLDMRPELDAAHALKLHERVTQADLLQHDPDNYPHQYDNVQSWLDGFAAEQADMIRDGMVTANLYGRELQSNVAERYKTIKLLAAMLGDRFDEPPSHLDIGSSVMHGDLKLAYNGMKEPVRFPFGPIDIVTPEDTNRYRQDHCLTHLANTALKQQVTFGPMMGVDITDIDDPRTRRWAKSCSFYPDELLDKARVTEYDVLDTLDPGHERVQFYQGDFADPHFDFKKFHKTSPAKEFDIITFSTVFYQVKRHERTRMLVNAARLLSQRGVIVIQDAADGDFSKRFNYTTSVIDNTQYHPTEQTLLRWETPRCRKAMLAMGHVSVGGKLRTFEEALKETRS